MVEAYWNIGKIIYEVCGENDRATYGKQILQYISEKLTNEFGTGFSIRNLRNMKRFYIMFPIRQTLSAELSWSHYQLLMAVENEKERDFYIQETIKDHWSVRQLKRQINTMFYKRILASRDKKAFPPKYRRPYRNPNTKE